MTGDLFRYYGMTDRPTCVGALLDVTNEEVRVMAELVGHEAREARPGRPDIGAALDGLSERLLRKAAEMDREAAG